VLGGVLAVPYTRNPLQRGGILFRGLIELGHYCHKWRWQSGPMQMNGVNLVRPGTEQP